MEAQHSNQSITLFYESSDKQALTAQVDRVLLTAGQSVVCPGLRCKSTSSDNECVPFPVTPRGKVESDEFSRAKGFETFFVIGDVAEIRSEKQEKPCPPTAQVAFQVKERERVGVISIATPRCVRCSPFCLSSWQVGFQVSDNVVNNVYTAITHSGPMRAFRYNHIGSMVSMGKMNGFCKLSFLFNGFEFDGPIAGIQGNGSGGKA